jgi:putative ABC transport system permease protein
MIQNYFKIAWRSLWQNKTYSAVNILGLAAGLASFVIILLYLNYELSYDKWNPALKNVARVSLIAKGNISPQTPAPLASFLKQYYPGIEAATAIQPAGDYEVLLEANGKKIYQKGVVTVDSSFLKVFPYKLLEGNAANALDQPNAAIISENLSHKLFGDIDPLGNEVKLYNMVTCVITGILQSPETPSHLDAQLVIRDPQGQQSIFWENYSFQTYIRLKPSFSAVKAEDAINRIYYNEHLKKDNRTFEQYKKSADQTALFTDAAADIHNFPKHASSNFSTVSTLLVLAVLLLLAGAINFSNLSVAKSMKRTKEVGMRKVLGSNRANLVIQFMSEAALQCILSLAIAVAVVKLCLPYLNRSFNIHLSFSQQGNLASLIVQVVFCLFLVIVLSGLYPSLLVSRFNTTKVLKGNYTAGKKGMLFRNSLIVVQFVVSAFFIIATLVIKSQMVYMQSKDKGFSDRQVIRIQATQHTTEDGFATARDMLLAIPGVSSVAKTTKVPGDKYIDTSTIGFKMAAKEYRMASVKISTDYFNTLQVGLVKGRLFNNEFADQNTQNAIINETAAKILHVANPIGILITFPFCDSVPVQIVGVVKDFNEQGFETMVKPAVYTIGNKACMYQSGGAILAKINTGDMSGSIAAIEQVWKKIEPDAPIRYSFLNENFKQIFSSYLMLQKVISFFTIIAILIAVMGLFALTAFFTKQRTKEIGIRKVLGATITNITISLGKDFILLVIISMLIVSPIAWYFLNNWLQHFAYHVSVSVWVFLLTAILSLTMAVITVSFQAVKAALMNPVKSLKTE